MNQLFNSLVLACMFFAGTIAAMADALVINQSMQASTILEAFVEEKSIRVEIEVSLSDVPAFADLLPDELYEKLCDFQAAPVDRCVLYVFRCAKYYTETTDHDPELLKWWNWKDK